MQASYVLPSKPVLVSESNALIGKTKSGEIPNQMCRACPEPARGCPVQKGQLKNHGKSDHDCKQEDN